MTKTKEQIAVERLETRRDEIAELLPFQSRETQRLEIQTEIDAINTVLAQLVESERKLAIALDVLEDYADFGDGETLADKALAQIRDNEY